jgi:hypothetical protein
MNVYQFTTKEPASEAAAFLQSIGKNVEQKCSTISMIASSEDFCSTLEQLALNNFIVLNFWRNDETLVRAHMFEEKILVINLNNKNERVLVTPSAMNQYISASEFNRFYAAMFRGEFFQGYISKKLFEQ